MNVELCDWCGNEKRQGSGATLKVYEHFENHSNYGGHRMWGTNYTICASCLKLVKQMADGIFE